MQYTEPKIVTTKSKILIGQSLEMSLTDNKTVTLFSNFMPKKKYIENKVSNAVFEVVLYNDTYFKNFNPSNTFTKWATVEVKEKEILTNGFEYLELTGGLYAVFNYKGLAKDFGNLMQYIFTDYLPKSKYALDNRPHYNVLGELTKRNSPDSEETVYIPIILK